MNQSDSCANTCEELSRVRALLRMVMLSGRFTHSDQNITRSICNACGNWAWYGMGPDGEDEGIKHRPGCPVADAIVLLQETGIKEEKGTK